MSILLTTGLVAGAGGLGFLGGRKSKNSGTATVSADITKNGYGYIPSLPDQRDFIYSSSMPESEQPLTLSLNDKMGPVFNQLWGDSCVANGLAEVVQFELAKRGLCDLTQDSVVSRMFVWYNTRYQEGTQSVNAGINVRDAIQTTSVLGICSGKHWPYDLTQLAVKPHIAAYNAATKDVIKKYSAITDHKSRIACLASGYPFIAGITVYSSFESPEVTKTGIVPMPAKTDTVLGGHLIVVIGYDKNAKTYLCRNSWGKTWGQQGNCTFPMDYLDSTTLSSDHWVINA